nr:MAG TPA: hypothetical protein [Caudoviricetes sp.]
MSKFCNNTLYTSIYTWQSINYFTLHILTPHS